MGGGVIMGEYNFILDNMRYSHSSASLFETCKYAFYLTYIECSERSNNFYSDYGLFVHDIMEKYFRRELDVMELSQYYIENYNKLVVSPPPSYPVGIDQKYYDSGLYFFDNFVFDIDNYETIIIEDKIDSVLNDIRLVVKPDLVLRHKETGKNYLIDYKSSNPYKYGKLDAKKVDGYKKQMYLYSYFLEAENNIKIDEIKLWFIRMNTVEVFPYESYMGEDTVKWFYNTILKSKEETDFEPNNTKENNYFCTQICSMRNICPYIT